MLRRRRDGPRARYFVAALYLAVGVLAPRAVLLAANCTLVGQVTLESGGTVGTLVSLQLELPTGEVVKKLIAGPDGRFEFLGLNNVLYRVRASTPGFEIAVKDADFNGPINEINLRIIMLPLRTPTTAPPLARSDERAPKKARKEFSRGSRALRENELDEARTHLEKAVEYFPCYARAQTDLALVYVRGNNVSSAEAALRKSIACDADFLDAYGWLAMVLNGTGHYAESQRILGEALRRAPDSWNLHYLLGEACSGLNQYDRAKEEYFKVRSLNPSPPAELHARLADLFHKMRDYDNAYAEMQAYLSADPQGRFAERTRTLMGEMLSFGLVHPAQTGPPPASLPKD
jgi:tetratricopeptide (TPR) repeat protein